MAATVSHIHEQAVFETARKIDSPAEREVYLKKACADDAALGKRVGELLRAFHEHDRFLEAPHPALVEALKPGDGDCCR